MADLTELEYIVFPRPERAWEQILQGEPWLNHFNDLYAYWKSSWTETFRSLNSESVPQTEDFLRQNIVSGLFCGGRPIGFQTNTFFNLSFGAHCDHPYMRRYPAETVTGLRSARVRRVMSIEYLYIEPEFRRSRVSASLSAVLLALALKCFQVSSCDAVVSIPRNDRGINRIFYALGAVPLRKDMELHNVKVDLILFTKKTPIFYSALEDRDLMQHFWTNRVDPCGMTKDLLSDAVSNASDLRGDCSSSIEFTETAYEQA